MDAPRQDPRPGQAAPGARVPDTPAAGTSTVPATTGRITTTGDAPATASTDSTVSTPAASPTATGTEGDPAARSAPPAAAGPGQPGWSRPVQFRRRPPEQPGGLPSGEGWAVFSYLVSGMIVYGLIGWLASRAAHTAIYFPLGMVTGLILAIVLIIYRYRRS